MTLQKEEYFIIEQCRKGNAEVYAVLVERYQEMIYNVAYRMLGDADSARDIAQESFISAYGALADFRNDSKFSTWLCSIAMNKCRDHLRVHRNMLPLDEIEEPAAARGSDPEAALSDKQSSRELQAALSALPEDYRQVIILKHIEGLDYREMEALLGVSVNALKVKTYRARECLKKYLGKRQQPDG
ncbi:MAG: sigma-70 family RNA polymerase sigma factor [Nitrospiraceae bacterium]|nr:sigma-70 family RNA polymerase sigma factor [Nitrospiraceae bacterium]